MKIAKQKHLLTLVAAGLVLPLALSQTSSKPQSGREYAIGPSGFATGNAFLKWNDDEQTAYGVGFYNGLSVSHLATGSAYEKVKWLDTCADGMEAEQIGAILGKYIKDHPAERQENLNTLGLNALNEACKK